MTTIQLGIPETQENPDRESRNEIKPVDCAPSCFLISLYHFMTDLSRTRRHGRKRSATSTSSNVPVALSLAAFWTPFPKSQETPVHCPAILCVELISMPFSSQPLVPADLASRLETRCSVLGSPFFGTEFGRHAFLCITDA
jgi:hypothetical protein